MKIRDSRIRAIQTLYNMELLDYSMDEALSNASEVDTMSRDFVKGIIENLTKIDEIIKSNLTNYSLDRLGFVDRAIIRLATFEMMNGLAPSIAIDEAIEITKIFTDSGDGKAKAFNNRLLDNIAKSLGE